MGSVNVIEKLKSLIGYIALFFMALSFSIAFTINFTPLYAFDIDHLNIEQMTGMPKRVLLENYKVVIDYLNFPWIKELSMPDFPASASGLFHFSEVKQLVGWDYVIFLIATILSLLFLKKIKEEKGYWKLLNPLRIMVAAPLVGLSLIIINFDQLFIAFHCVFFNNDAWIFDSRTDPIIMALPEDFFMHCFVLVIILMELFLMLLLSWAKKKVKQA